MTDKPTTDRKIGALDSCLIVNRVISFLCDRFEDVVGLADQYRTATAFWKNGGNRMNYVKTMQDGTDGELSGGTIPKIAGTSVC